MNENETGYVKTYDSQNGYGFCMVHDLNGERKYTDVFFHISDIDGLNGLEVRKHVLTGKVEKNSQGWEMTEISATYDPDAWDQRPQEIENSDEKFESTQPKRMPSSLKKGKKKADDTRIRPRRQSKKNDDEDREGGYWKGDKYIPK